LSEIEADPYVAQIHVQYTGLPQKCRVHFIPYRTNLRFTFYLQKVIFVELVFPQKYPSSCHTNQQLCKNEVVLIFTYVAQSHATQ
jgi:hypothetical protein